jgi:putative membrane protein
MDRNFIEDQLQDGQAEIRLGQLASERASSPRVKEFAQMMVQDHTKAGNELREIVQQANLQLEQGDQEHQDLIERLSKLSGAEFDREYMEAMVNDHEDAVSELERRTDNENPQIRQYAANTLPVVRQHLERAQEIQKGLEGQSEGQ